VDDDVDDPPITADVGAVVVEGELDEGEGDRHRAPRPGEGVDRPLDLRSEDLGAPRAVRPAAELDPGSLVRGDLRGGAVVGVGVAVERALATDQLDHDRG
jgi:hypothetical protein